MNELFRQIPSMDLILEQDGLLLWIDDYGREYVKDKTREVINKIKKDISSGKLEYMNMSVVIDRLGQLLDGGKCKSLKPVINGTGVLLHTNLGRALYSEDMADAVYEVLTHYNNLEFDVETGKRGHRDTHIESLIKDITGAEAALVVNNNAAAVMLMLDTFSKGKEAIVSRGELVEIGGSFRIPSVMEASGAIMKEVGTTNKTHFYDYATAISEETGVIMKVHTSNYRVVGFTESVPAEQLVELGKRYEIPVIEDLGAGSLVPLDQYGLEREPTVQEQIEKGIDLVSFSGDKLLGGPQCGIIVGKKRYVEMIRKNQLLRALRVGKLTLSVLTEVLSKYLYNKYEEIPFYKMLKKDDAWFLDYFERVKSGISKEFLKVEMIDTTCQVGGGSLPMERIPSKGIAIDAKAISAKSVLDALRGFDVPIIGRIENDRCIIEMRTLSLKDVGLVIEGINAIE